MNMGLGHARGGAAFTGVGVAVLALLALGACRGSGNTNETMESAFVLPVVHIVGIRRGTAGEFTAAVAPLDKAGIRHVDQWGRGDIEVWVPTSDWAAREGDPRAGRPARRAPPPRRGARLAARRVHAERVETLTIAEASRPNRHSSLGFQRLESRRRAARARWGEPHAAGRARSERSE